MPRTAPLSRIAAKIENIPMVHHIHCPTLYDSPNPIKNLVSATIERISLIGVDRVIPCSEGMKQYANSVGISDKNITVVLNGIPSFGPLLDRAEPSTEWVFGIVALFRPRKGLEYLLKAMERLKSKNFRFKLRAIGDFMTEEYRREILQLVKQLGIENSVDWVGFKKDIPAELKQLDFFVLPSIGGEGLPIAILEAMAAGLPVITTEIAGSKEVIRDGVDGYLCQPSSIDSLTASLEKIMCNPKNWANLRNHAYQRQQEYFSDHSMTAAVARIYNEILGNQ
jgi:glycosyltransferase involved in cell wall biosynthesis